MGCSECGVAYSFVFRVQFHRVDCSLIEPEQLDGIAEYEGSTSPNPFEEYTPESLRLSGLGGTRLA